MNSDRTLQNLSGRPGPVEFFLPRGEGMDWAVVIPVRNRPDLLEKCLDSIRKQQFPDGRGEVLICDDGSTEDLSAVVERFISSLPNLRILRQPPKGPAAARNLGLRWTNADIIVLLDSDVICEKHFLRKIIEALYAHLNWAGAEASILPEGKKEGPLWESPVCRDGGLYQTAGIAYRREALIRVGGFDEAFKLPACEDAEIAWRILKENVIGFVPEAIVYHPARRVTLRTLWRWSKFWKYEMILAKRYGFLAFPGRPAGRVPRFRVALCAVINLPGRIFLDACKYLPMSPREGIITWGYAFFNFICGLVALPEILFGEIPEREKYV